MTSHPPQVRQRSEVRLLLIWGAREGSAEQKSWWDPNERRKHTHVWDSSLLPLATFTEKTRVIFDMPLIRLWRGCMQLTSHNGTCLYIAHKISLVIRNTSNVSCLAPLTLCKPEGKHLYITSCIITTFLRSSLQKVPVVIMTLYKNTSFLLIEWVLHRVVIINQN